MGRRLQRCSPRGRLSRSRQPRRNAQTARTSEGEPDFCGQRPVLPRAPIGVAKSRAAAAPTIRAGRGRAAGSRPAASRRARPGAASPGPAPATAEVVLDCIEGWESQSLSQPLLPTLFLLQALFFCRGLILLYGSPRQIPLTRRVSSAFDEIMSPTQGNGTKSLWTIRAGHSNIATKSVRQSDMRCDKHPTRHYRERLRRPWLRQQQCALFPAPAGMQC